MRTSMNSSISSLLRARSLISWPPGPIRTAVGVLSLFERLGNPAVGVEVDRHDIEAFGLSGEDGPVHRGGERDGDQVAELRLPPRHGGQEEPAFRTLRVGEDQLVRAGWARGRTTA
jgi:hypothetical protein